MNAHVKNLRNSTAIRGLERKDALGLERKDALGLERKDGGDNQTELKKSFDDFLGVFEEFKKTNDRRLDEISKKGQADPTIDDKLAKMETSLADSDKKFAEYAEQKKVAEEQKSLIETLQENFDKLETAVNRSGTGSDVKNETKRAEMYVRAVVELNNNGGNMASLNDEQKQLFIDLDAERKALNVSNDTAGGYLAPTEYVHEIIKAVTEVSPVRSLARVRQTSMQSVQIPKRTGTFAAAWVAEQGTKSETTGLTYGMHEIPTHEFYALVDISNQMLEDSAFDMNAEISMESAEQFALAEGAAFVNGDGVGKPFGFMQNGDVESTNSGAATAVTADGMITMKYTLKTAYAGNAQFLMNRQTMGTVRKLKDGDGNYIWKAGLELGRPGTIDGDPYTEMPDMPNEGAGLKPVAYGDFRRGYTWIDRIAMAMMRDPFTQATAGNIRYIMRKRVGGQVTQSEALKTLTCSV